MKALSLSTWLWLDYKFFELILSKNLPWEDFATFYFGMTIHVFYFIRTPFFPAQPGVAYRKAVFEPQVCLDVCLTNQKTFVHEITKKVVLDTIELGIVYD